MVCAWGSNLIPKPKLKDEMIQKFKKIRKMKMKSAHEVEGNRLEQEYFKKQRKLIIEAHLAVGTLRLILANHPGAKTCDVPEWLYKRRNLEFLA